MSPHTPSAYGHTPSTYARTLSACARTPSAYGSAPARYGRGPAPDYGQSPHIVIAGGGVAGLTAALALHAAGFERVTVVEAAPAIRPVGAGLNLMPNAVRELDALGLLDALEAGALRTRELRYYHRSGGLISREPRGLGAGYRWPQLSVHRGHLQQVLAGAVRARLGPAALVTGVRVTGLELPPGRRPRLRLEHREGAVKGRASLEPDVLIGGPGKHWDDPRTATTIASLSLCLVLVPRRCPNGVEHEAVLVLQTPSGCGECQEWKKKRERAKVGKGGGELVG